MQRRGSTRLDNRTARSVIALDTRALPQLDICVEIVDRSIERRRLDSGFGVAEYESPIRVPTQLIVVCPASKHLFGEPSPISACWFRSEEIQELGSAFYED